LQCRRIFYLAQLAASQYLYIYRKFVLKRNTSKGAAMPLPSKFGIQCKAFIVLLLSVGLIAAAVLSGLRTLKLRQLRSEAMTVADQVVSFRSWVGGTGVVWVDHLADNFPDFLGERKTEAGSFFSKNPALATRELSDIVGKSSSRATFRVTSDKYRNRKNTPDSFESSAIRIFQTDGSKAYVEIFEDGYYRYAQPIYIKKDCLKCHGDPKDAPQDVISKYGAEMAFGYKEGMMRGIISVRLPDVAIVELARMLISPYSMALLILVLILNIVFIQFALIRRLHRLAVTAEQIAGGGLFLDLPDKKSLHDEIDQVSHSIGLLRASLAAAIDRSRSRKIDP
jgi:hypothetical protein